MSVLKTLGPLEAQVMQILWARGECCVHDVMSEMRSRLAYTTVMTTMDRLYKKGILSRRREERAFFYVPAMSKAEWEKQTAEQLITGYLAGPTNMPELLVSSFVDALGQHDAQLLDDLERKIQRKRRELSRKGRT